MRIRTIWLAAIAIGLLAGVASADPSVTWRRCPPSIRKRGEDDETDDRFKKGLVRHAKAQSSHDAQGLQRPGNEQAPCRILRQHPGVRRRQLAVVPPSIPRMQKRHKLHTQMALAGWRSIAATFRLGKQEPQVFRLLSIITAAVDGTIAQPQRRIMP
ncbi:hypothetical protein [Mesorhizobium delmotii]|uniref:hypothetical protein n=1 Tax=Mesorhizobium delmotii TaxID=1631247 RepID=UPI0010580936|nr:hypothetical protein [Mesorhizobium delmotii]